MRINLGGFLAKASITVFALIVYCGGSRTSSAQGIILNLEDAPLSVPKNYSKTKRIVGVPTNAPGILSLTVKWHAKSLIPNTFNKLTVVLLHGSRIVKTSDCYSDHSDKTPKCHITQSISQTEANLGGDWKLRVDNDSANDVDGFNILKESSDVNPFVRDIKSTFSPDCGTSYLFMYPELSIGPRSTVEKAFTGVTNIQGKLQLRAKWHTSQTAFQKLKVEVLRDGNVVATDEGYSIHSDQRDKTDKINININVGVNESTGWRIRVINNDYVYINGFALEKGRDPNPFVPVFRSVYLPCQ